MLINAAVHDLFSKIYSLILYYYVVFDIYHPVAFILLVVSLSGVLIFSCGSFPSLQQPYLSVKKLLDVSDF